jgi:hypothetical protein
MIDTAPATTPIEITDAKPSDILKSMPREKWGTSHLLDCEGHYCALGWLGHVGGFGNLAREYSEDYEAIREGWGLSGQATNAVVSLNDSQEGLDAVIRYLESIGK